MSERPLLENPPLSAGTTLFMALPGCLILANIAYVQPILAGRQIDRGRGPALIFTGTLVAVCLPGVAVFVCAALLLDPGVSVAASSVQQHILAALPAVRGQANALNVACNFCGCALGSALGPWLFARFGWRAVAAVGCALMLISFILNLLVRRGERRTG